MRHLTPQELIDLAEDERLEPSLPHLASCDHCRREITNLRAAMGRAAEAEVPEPSPLFWEHFSSRVREAIARLPRKQRATLILRMYHEMSHQEIAEVLGSSVGAVKANFFHALGNLKKLLGDEVL